MNFETVTTNLRLEAGHRRETLDGRDYLVVPVAMLTVGVHKGSVGPLLYTENELKRFTSVWNMKPLVVYHPKDGKSACTASTLESQGVGMLMNTHFKNNKLRAEAWFDVAKSNKVDPRIMERVDAGYQMEVSTGLFTEIKDQEGVFNGTSYTATVVGMRPDHLALLPDQVGACSMAKGAGLGVMNVDTEQQLRGLLTAELKEGYGDIEILSLGQSNVLVRNQASTYLIPYISEGDNVVVDNNQVQEFMANAKTNPRKEDSMDIKVFVQELIANEHSKWTPEDAEFLEGLTEVQLENMAPVVIETEVIKEVQVPAAPVENKETVDEAKAWLEGAPKHVQEMLAVVENQHAAIKATHIEAIVANKSNVFAPEWLSEQTVDCLAGMALLCNREEEVPATPTKVTPMYAAQGTVQNTTDVGNTPASESGMAAPDWSVQS